MRRFLSLFVWLVLAVHPLQAASTASHRNLEKALAAIRGRDPDAARDIERIISRNQPFFLIVPGILGSKLVDGKEVVWGSIETEGILRADPDRLKYPDRKLDPAELLAFDFVGGRKEQVYGPLISKLGSINPGSGIEHYAMFPYDWRQPITESATKLDERIRSSEWASKLRNRDVIVVGHSMGGLVATWWYKTIYELNPGAYDFRIANLFLVGVPNRGAPSSLAAFIKGYGPTKPSWIEQQIYGLVFRELNQAAVTFPGLFDLLPIDTVVWEVNGAEVVGSVTDLFKVDVWKRYDWAQSARGRKSKEDFYELFAPKLKHASDVFDQLRDRGPLPPEKTYYFFSRNRDTVAGIDMIVGGTPERPIYTTKLRFALGDERIPETIAVPRHIAERHPDHAIELTEIHGTLPNDPVFLKFVQDFRWSHIARTNRDFIELARSKPVVMEEMRRAGALLELPTDPDALKSSAARESAEFNATLFAADAPDPATAAYRYAKRAGADDPSAAQIYATSVALAAEGTLRPASQLDFNTGVALLEAGEPAAAAEYLQAALTSIPDLPNESRSSYLGKVHANLGVAYERMKKYPEAIAEYDRAIALSGHSNAKKNREMLRRALRQQGSR